MWKLQVAKYVLKFLGSLKPISPWVCIVIKMRPLCSYEDIICILELKESWSFQCNDTWKNRICLVRILVKLALQFNLTKSKEDYSIFSQHSQPNTKPLPKLSRRKTPEIKVHCDLLHNGTKTYNRITSHVRVPPRHLVTWVAALYWIYPPR